MSQEAPEPEEESGGESLSMWQRVVAGLFGLGAGGAGGASVFMTSNQAGSVALLGVGAGFLIMAVNGTPIIGAKLKDYELKLAPRRAQVVKRALSEPPEEASHTLDVLKQVDPGARADPAVRRATAYVYEAEVHAALARVLADFPAAMVSDAPQNDDYGVDFSVRLREKLVDIRSTFRSKPEVPLDRQFVRKMYEGSSRRSVPVIVITNCRLSNLIYEIAQREDPEGRKVQFVRWTDRQDDVALKLALSRLLGGPDTSA